MPAAVPADVVLVGLVDAGTTDTGPTRVCPGVTVAPGRRAAASASAVTSASTRSRSAAGNRTPMLLSVAQEAT